MNVVIYHGGCSDGAAAAWCMSLILDNDTTLYHAGKFNENYPDIKDKNVIFVDFSYKLEQMIKLIREAKTVLVLDHHQSSKKLEIITDENFSLLLDINRSGSQIAWDYVRQLYTVTTTSMPAKYFSSSYENTPVNIEQNDIVDYVMSFEDGDRPWFIDDIAERDLWKWSIPESKDSTKGMYESGFNKVNSFYNLIYLTRESFVTKGRILNEYDEKKCKNITNTAIDCYASVSDNDKKWRCRVVQCDYSYASEVGSQLVADGLVDFSVMYRYLLDKDEWRLSVRALNTKSIDLVKILTKFDTNAGGHSHAAGFSIYGSKGHSLKTFFSPCKHRFQSTPF